MRPPCEITSARPPAVVIASAISIAESSAPPVSSSGTICNMVGGGAVKTVTF